VPASVRSRRTGDVLLIELNSADGFPRLGQSVLDSLHHAMEFAAAPGIRGVVLVGTGQSFAVGAELEEVAALEPLAALRFSALGQGLLRRMESFRQPIIAAVSGFCLGGGLDLALACSARVASDDAVFAHPGATLGIITGWGGTVRLPRLVGRGRALEMFVTGNRLTATEAFACGLVQRLVPREQLLNAALGLARRGR
jgi:enoyl-CoA hydratase